MFIKADYLISPSLDYVRVLKDAGVCVENDVIVDVGKEEDVRRKCENDITLRGRIVMPGLIDLHRHLYGILTRGMPVNKAPRDFRDFLEDLWWPYVEDKLDKDLIYVAAKASALEALKYGTTTIVDILEAPYSLPNSLEVERKALYDVGLRGFLSFEVTERAGTKVRDLSLAENENFIIKTKNDPLVKGMMATHTTFTCSKETLLTALDIAKKHNSKILLHLEEGDYEKLYSYVVYKKLPVEWYESLGFLGPHIIAAQFVTTEPKELMILKKHQVNLVHVPLSNCEVGGGIAPAAEALDLGLKVGLGTDGYITNMFEVMRFTFLIHKARLKDPRTMPAEQVFNMATSFGEIILGEKIGRIEKDYKADLVLLEFRFPEIITSENLVTLLVLWGADYAKIHTVIVNGKIMIENGKHVSLDEDTLVSELKKASLELWSRCM